MCGEIILAFGRQRGPGIKDFHCSAQSCFKADSAKPYFPTYQPNNLWKMLQAKGHLPWECQLQMSVKGFKRRISFSPKEA